MLRDEIREILGSKTYEEFRDRIDCIISKYEQPNFYDIEDLMNDLEDIVAKYDSFNRQLYPIGE